MTPENPHIDEASERHSHILDPGFRCENCGEEATLKMTDGTKVCLKCFLSEGDEVGVIMRKKAAKARQAYRDNAAEVDNARETRQPWDVIQIMVHRRMVSMYCDLNQKVASTAEEFDMAEDAFRMQITRLRKKYNKLYPGSVPYRSAPK